MLLDGENQFSEDQVITASAPSTNVINITGMGDLAKGQAVAMFVHVKEDFAALTSLAVQIQESDDAAFTSPEEIVTSPAIILADLKVGYRFPLRFYPATTKPYQRLYYTVVGADATAGKISSGLVSDIQDSV